MKSNAVRSLWESRRLGELFRIKHGYAFKGQFFADRGLYVVLTPGNFYDQGGFKLKGEKEKYYTGGVPGDFVLKKGDLLVVMTEQAEGLLGSPAIIPENDKYLHNQRLGLVTHLMGEMIEKKFLYFLFNSRKVRSQIRASASGVKVRHTSPERIYEVKVIIPSVLVQQKIAAILSAYDDLIENNLRRIEILEEMAQTLYREWFVKFRFPGHQKVKMVDSSLGKIPDGWEVVKVGSQFQTVLGGTPSRNKPEYWNDGSIPWINSGKVNDLRIIEPSELITDLGLKRSAAKVMPKRTTVIAITGATLGQVSLLEIETSANQSVVGISDSSEKYSEWLYLFFCERIEEIINFASGGAQQHINKEIVDDVILPLPMGKLISEFNRSIKPIFDQIAGLLFKNRILRQTRDLLLPKLISGELDVSELDIPISEANA